MTDERGFKLLQVEVLGQQVSLETRPGLFSPEHVDRGTLAMLSHVKIASGMRIMDLGCGCGVVGIVAAKIAGEENVFMSDADPMAVETARRNAERNGVGGVQVCVSDGFQSVDASGFDLILSNPPYQTDFSVAKGFIEKGFNRLKIGGKLYMVTKRRAWYKNKMISVFGGVEIRETDGYYVFIAERRSLKYANKAPRRM
ncbi:MAG: methyltransferase [Clostridia bacterium]|nr:methyltransferase [Clostridia bacterium]